MTEENSINLLIAEGVILGILASLLVELYALETNKLPEKSPQVYLKQVYLNNVCAAFVLFAGAVASSELTEIQFLPVSPTEVADAIRKLCNNKAPGEDGIPADIYNSCLDTVVPQLHGVIERAWRDEIVPDNWRLDILIPILKKVDKTRCENYGAISLVDVAAKIFAIARLRRFQAVRDSRTRPNQDGFLAGRGCADQILKLRRILEFCHNYQQPTAVHFIDFAVAFHSVHRGSLWRIMAPDGIPAKVIAMIKAYYRSTTVRILVRDNLTQPFGIRSGVRQGCILSLIVFNCAVHWILGRTLHEDISHQQTPDIDVTAETQCCQLRNIIHSTAMDNGEEISSLISEKSRPPAADANSGVYASKSTFFCCREMTSGTISTIGENTSDVLSPTTTSTTVTTIFSCTGDADSILTCPQCQDRVKKTGSGRAEVAGTAGPAPTRATTPPGLQPTLDHQQQHSNRAQKDEDDWADMPTTCLLIGAQTHLPARKQA
nr:unnamed protein product [Spirometra erinaceieuropaei]